GAWDGQPLTSVTADEWAAWRDNPGFTPPGGESLQMVQDRAVACADELLEAGRTTIAVSHVSPIRAIVAWSLGAGVEATWRMHLDVAAICSVARRGAHPLLLSFNQRAPFPAAASR